MNTNVVGIEIINLFELTARRSFEHRYIHIYICITLIYFIFMDHMYITFIYSADLVFRVAIISRLFHLTDIYLESVQTRFLFNCISEQQFSTVFLNCNSQQYFSTLFLNCIYEQYFWIVFLDCISQLYFWTVFLKVFLNSISRQYFASVLIDSLSRPYISAGCFTWPIFSWKVVNFLLGQPHPYLYHWPSP